MLSIKDDELSSKKSSSVVSESSHHSHEVTEPPVSVHAEIRQVLSESGQLPRADE